ncbi:Uncharacterised protein [Burkholderia pseudomallei]|nr:Uncharacterised protein [Burkholderia pseudomallei]VBS04690.1 Uncharacterised protein [Burkholderia pseudomallei]
MAERAFHAFRAPARVPVMRNGTGRRRSPARNARAALAPRDGQTPPSAVSSVQDRSCAFRRKPIATLEHGDMHSCRIVISLAIHRIRRFRHGSKQYVTLAPARTMRLTPLPYRTAVRRSAAAFSRACAPRHRVRLTRTAVQAPGDRRRRPDRAKERLDAIPAAHRCGRFVEHPAARVSSARRPTSRPFLAPHACKHRLGPYAPCGGARPNGVTACRRYPARAPGIR